MDNLRDGALEHALEMSAQMLGAARSGDWVSVATMHAECDALLRRDYAADDTTRVALLELQRQHQDLTELAGQARDVIAQELGRRRHNHRALSAYLGSCEK